MDKGIIETCASCKYWDLANTNYLEECLKVHPCTRVKQFRDVTEWSEKFDRILKREFKDDLAFVNDGSSYRAELLTLADFFCAHWEKKE